MFDIRAGSTFAPVVARPGTAFRERAKRELMAFPALARGGMDSIVLVNWGCLAVTLVGAEGFLRRRAIFPVGRTSSRERIA